MKKFDIKKILVPLDFSETSLLALEHAGFMAGLFKAEMILLHIIQPKWPVFNWEFQPVLEEDLESLNVRVEKKLEELSEQVRQQHGIKPRAICSTGKISGTIVKTAEENKVDIIIMGTHGTSGFEEKFIGSNAYRVVNESYCPVISVRMHAVKKGFKNIVLPIDNSHYSLQKVNHAVEIAKHYGSKITILGLSDTDDADEMKIMKMKTLQVEKHLQKHEILFEKRLKVGSNYAKLTMNFATENGSDLIIIMSEWDEDLTGMFIGPFARQIVNHSSVPVMSVRPEVKPELIASKVAYY